VQALPTPDRRFVHLLLPGLALGLEAVEHGLRRRAPPSAELDYPPYTQTDS